MNSLFLLFLLSFPALLFACSCIPQTFESALKNTDSIFRGSVLRELELPSDLFTRAFEVSIKRIFKGCLLQSPGSVIVTTGSNSALCGIDFLIEKNYVFFGKAMRLGSDSFLQPYMKQFSNQTFVQFAYLCSFTELWSGVPTKERDLLKNYTNKCARKCKTGKDCLKDSYCDTGKCVAYNAPCPDDQPPVRCFADPCKVTKPCVNNATCLSNYCGGCNAIFIDANRTRVCV